MYSLVLQHVIVYQLTHTHHKWSSDDAYLGFCASALNVDPPPYIYINNLQKTTKFAKIDHHPSLNQLTAMKQNLLIKGGLVIHQIDQLIRQLMSQSGMYVTESHLERFTNHL